MNQSSVCSNAPTADEEMVPRDYKVGYDILGKRIGTTPTVTTTVSVSMEMYSELNLPDQATQVCSVHRNTKSIDLFSLTWTKIYNVDLRMSEL